MKFWKSKKTARSEQLEKVAHHLHLNYHQTDDLQILRLLLDFKLFSQGHSKKISNLMWTDDENLEIRTRIFDYEYTVSAGNSHQKFQRTVFFFNSKKLGLPEFRMQPEKFIHRLAAWLGWNDIDFESHETFSKQYHLTGADEDLIRDTFTDDVLHYFSFQNGWCVEGLNYYLIIYRNDNLLKIEEIDKFYHTANEIYRLLEGKGFSI